MIQKYSYLVDLGEATTDPKTLAQRAGTRAAIAAFVVPLGLRWPQLRGFYLEWEGDGMRRLRVTMRLAGLTQWHIKHDAPRILAPILRKVKLPISSASFEKLETEYGRSYRKMGEGRTEATRRPRSERMADGRPWDHIAWEEEL